MDVISAWNQKYPPENKIELNKIDSTVITKSELLLAKRIHKIIIKLLPDFNGKGCFGKLMGFLKRIYLKPIIGNIKKTLVKDISNKMKEELQGV